MDRRRKIVCLASLLFIGAVICGCEGPVSPTKGTRDLGPETELGNTIGTMADVFSFDVILVEGYSVVGGLNGTGSTQCRPEIRDYLKKYIRRQLPKADVDELINSPDTAVVMVQGMMPAAVSKNQYFDVTVVALPNTETTSLEGGRLYGVELREAGKFGLPTRILAKAEGPIFINKLGNATANKRVGYVLAGGIVLDEYKTTLFLRWPNYVMANLIRNRLNGRFGPDTVGAVSDSAVEVKIPAEYAGQKKRFTSIVKAMYLEEEPDATRERIRSFVIKLATSEHKEESEIALEAIGNESLNKVAALLNSSNEQVRLRAARCMLNMGSDRGLRVLRQIAMNKASAHRLAALDSITQSARRNDAAEISRRLLRDENFDIRLVAYENLRKLEDIAIRQEVIAGDFFLEQIAQTKYEGIFVSRKGQPRIVLFGAPIHCRQNIFVQSADGAITINARLGDTEVSIMRKIPTKPNAPPAKLTSSFELRSIIRTLCESPIVEKRLQLRPGLGVSYADAIALLQQMSEKGAVEADFRAGPMPKIGLIMK